MPWFKEDEDALVERNLRSLRAEASRYGGDTCIPEAFLRGVALSQALAFLHHRETLRALQDTLPRPRVHKAPPSA